MSRSVNKVFILGHLGKDAETKFTPNGTPVTNFSVATENRWKDKQSGEWKSEAEWHRCLLWNAEQLATYLTKGKQVHIEGRLRTRSYEDREGIKRYTTEIVVDNLSLLGGGGNNNREEHQGQQQDSPMGPMDPDDVPF